MRIAALTALLLVATLSAATARADRQMDPELRGVLAEVDSNPRAASIAHAMIALCRGLGLQVTVEGVERASQLDFLAGRGELSVQGFLIARPMDADGVLESVGRMGPRIRALLDAGERGRPDLQLDDPDGTIRRLRRRPR